MYENGRFEARNGDAYTADADVHYSADATYHVRMVVGLAAAAYNVWVTPPGGAETH